MTSRETPTLCTANNSPSTCGQEEVTARVLLSTRLGKIFADAVTFDEAVEIVGTLVSNANGGYVVTPNVDHVVQAQHNAQLLCAYENASLSLVDGMPLVWLSQLMRKPLPEKISGADIFEPLVARAASSGWRVFLFGGEPGVADAAAKKLREKYPALMVAGTASPPLGFDRDPVQRAHWRRVIMDGEPQLVFFALGCPKQELLMYEWREELSPAVCAGIGATFDFVTGRVKRAPTWMSRYGVEWLYRLAQDPVRLAHRYFVRDLGIFPIIAQMLRLSPEERRFRRTVGG